MSSRFFTIIFILSSIGLYGQRVDRNVGVFYYPWYDTERHWPEGFMRELLNPPQMPLLGKYKSRAPSVIDQHITWSEEYGIDNWICSWWGKDSWGDITIKNSIMPRIFI